MVCMDGFILTHAYEEVDIPNRSRSTHSSPHSSPRQSSTRKPVTIGAMVGPEAFFEVKYLARQADAGARPDPEVARVSRASSAGSRAGSCAPTGRGRRDDRRRARLGARDDRGGGRRAARPGVRIGALGLKSFRPFPLEDVRGALGGASAWSSSRGARCGDRRDRLGQRPRAWPASRLHGDRRARRPLYHQGVAAAAVRGGRPRRAEAAQLPRPEERDRRARAGPGARGPRLGPARENILKDIGVVAAEPH